jgi:uncharacterized protein YecE (DUF72 family)
VTGRNAAGPTTRRGEILFGVAGWSYPDWKGVVYPSSCKDTLRFVADRVDLIEINNTFYRPPSARNCASWVERTEEPGTFFTAKLPHECTHERTRDVSFFADVRAGFLPLIESGRLLGLLAQFDFRFQYGPDAMDHVALLAQHLGGEVQLICEVRHRSWNAPAALEKMRSLGISIAALDYPGMASGFDLDVPAANGRADLAYFRLHGRNRAWFQKGAGRDRVYDWEYSKGEVCGIEQRVDRIASGAARTLVVANNHYQGKAMKLLEQLVEHYRRPGSASDVPASEGSSGA